jgi:hypothetical protein
MAAHFAPYTPPPDEAASASLFAIDSPPASPASPSHPGPAPARVLGGGAAGGEYDWHASYDAHASSSRWTPARLCSAAYLLPPLSAGGVLLLERHNVRVVLSSFSVCFCARAMADGRGNPEQHIVRFHACQAALLALPFGALLALLRAAGFWWLSVVLLFAGVGWSWVAG